MKKHTKCLIIFIVVLLAWYLFIDIAKALKGERLIFFERWRFSDMQYTKNIDLQSYLLNEEQIIELLKNPGKELVQLTNEALFNEKVTLVLRIKNKRNAVCWGTLLWNRDDSHWYKIDIWDIPPKRITNVFSDYFIPLGEVIVLRNKSIPDVKTKWKSFYTYK